MSKNGCPPQQPGSPPTLLLLARGFVQAVLDGVQEVGGVQEVLVQLHVAETMDASHQVLVMAPLSEHTSLLGSGKT